MTRPDGEFLPSLYLITDRQLARPNLPSAVEAALRGGVRMVQLREKDLAATELKTLALNLRKLTRHFGARLLLNGNPELALEVGADGVQLGVGSCGIADARQLLGAGALIGYSAHSRQEVEKAAVLGADFVTFSPIFYTPSKARYGPPQGLDALRDLCRHAPLPVYALGGINAARLNSVLEAGACGAALISAIFAAPDPNRAVATLLRQVNSFTRPG